MLKTTQRSYQTLSPGVKGKPKEKQKKPFISGNKDCLSAEYVQSLALFPIIELQEAKRLNRTERSFIGTLLALCLQTGSVMIQQRTLSKFVSKNIRTASRIMRKQKNSWYNRNYSIGNDYDTKYFKVLSGKDEKKANIYEANMSYFMDPMLKEVRDYFLSAVNIMLLKSMQTKCRTYYKNIILRILNTVNKLCICEENLVQQSPPHETKHFFPRKKEKVRVSDRVTHTTSASVPKHGASATAHSPRGYFANANRATLKCEEKTSKNRTQGTRKGTNNVNTTMTESRKNSILKKMGLLDPQVRQAFVREENE